MTDLEQKLWEAVYNLTTPDMPEGNGVLEAIQKPLGANTPVIRWKKSLKTKANAMANCLG